MGSAMAPPSITYPVSHLRQFSEGPDGPVEATRSGVDQFVDAAVAGLKLVDAGGHGGLVGRVMDAAGGHIFSSTGRCCAMTAAGRLLTRCCPSIRKVWTPSRETDAPERHSVRGAPTYEVESGAGAMS